MTEWPASSGLLGSGPQANTSPGRIAAPVVTACQPVWGVVARLVKKAANRVGVGT